MFVVVIICRELSSNWAVDFQYIFKDIIDIINVKKTEFPWQQNSETLEIDELWFK